MVKSIGTILGLMVSLGVVAEARAATITVTTTSTAASPSGCGIREALVAVNTQTATGGCAAGNGSSDTIVLPSGTLTATTPLIVTRSVEIRGAGVSSTTIRGNLSSGTMVFSVSGSTVTTNVIIRDLTIDRAAGQPVPEASGVHVWNTDDTKHVRVELNRTRVTGHTRGGVLSEGGHVEVVDSIIESNSSPLSGGGVAVFNNGTARASTNVLYSTIANNSSAGCGGGIHHGAQGNSHLTSTTVSGNTADGSGGGLCVNGHGDYFQVDDSTIAFNSTGAAGGGVASSGPVNFWLSSSIVAENAAHVYQDWDGYVTLLSNSLIGDSWGLDIQNVDEPSLLDVDSGLDSNLRFHGGTNGTRAHRLLSSSQAVDYFVGSSSQDQRHFPKGLEGDGTLGANLWDIGAFEYDRHYHELEEATVAASSGDSISVHSNSSYSNAGARRLNSNATNDYVTFTIGIPESGNYRVKVRVSSGLGRGTFQLGYSTTSGGSFTNVGSVRDTYATSTLYQELTISNSVALSAGLRYFRFRVAGKHADSANYNLYLDALQLTKL